MAHELSSKVIVPKRNVNMPTHCKLGIMPHAAHATYFLLHLMFTTLISIGLKVGPGWSLIICFTYMAEIFTLIVQIQIEGVIF